MRKKRRKRTTMMMMIGQQYHHHHHHHHCHYCHCCRAGCYCCSLQPPLAQGHPHLLLALALWLSLVRYWREVHLLYLPRIERLTVLIRFPCWDRGRVTYFHLHRWLLLLLQPLCLRRWWWLCQWLNYHCHHYCYRCCYWLLRWW